MPKSIYRKSIIAAIAGSAALGLGSLKVLATGHEGSMNQSQGPQAYTQGGGFQQGGWSQGGMSGQGQQSGPCQQGAAGQGGGMSGSQAQYQSPQPGQWQQGYAQGGASGQQGQGPTPGQHQGPIDKMTSVVKEKLNEWGVTSGSTGQNQGQWQQPSGQQSSGPQQSFGGQNAQAYGQLTPTDYFRGMVTREFEIQRQNCETLKFQNPQAQQQCEQQARSRLDQILKQGSVS